MSRRAATCTAAWSSTPPSAVSTHCSIEPTDEEHTEFFAADFDQALRVPLSAEQDLSGSLVLHRAVYSRIVKEFLDGKAPALRVVTYSDAPPGSGVGSSSALVVAMVQAYAELLQLPLGEYDVAHLAYEIERVDCAMAGGKQDQCAAAFGGFNFMEFGAGGRVVVNPLRLKRELTNELESRVNPHASSNRRLRPRTKAVEMRSPQCTP